MAIVRRRAVDSGSCLCMHAPHLWIDDLIRPQQQRRWDAKAEGLGGLDETLPRLYIEMI